MNRQQLTGLSESHLVEVQTRFQTVKVYHQIEIDLVALVNAADQAGFQLEIASGYRNFHRQKRIWDRKYSGQSQLLDSQSCPIDVDKLSEQERLFSILRWSALPGASRHHWGTDLDVYAKNLLPEGEMLLLEPWEYSTGHQSSFYDWLKKNSHNFGFFFPYQTDRGGVAPEAWHISHLSSSLLCQTALSLEQIKKTLNEEKVLGLSVINANFDDIYTQYITNICEN